ncbi:MAG: hypothetical protein AAF581_08210, partial [Planctomycetota bacterium]
HFSDAKWHAGLPREALRIYRDPGLRDLASEIGAVTFLVRCHIKASKCAIDLGSADLALEELYAAEDVLNARASESRLDAYRGYAQLYAGEVAVLRGDHDKGIEYMKAAQAWFEEMSPPRTAAALDAKVSLAQVALEAGEYRTAFAIITKLLEESTQAECWDARSRLLFLQSYLFVSDDPPLRTAFDDLVLRTHLINNPALMLKTLSNLLIHAVEYLGDDDQAFLRKRIGNLQQFLEQDCFDSLYRTYVTERYAPALERRLEKMSQSGPDPADGELEP